MSGLQNGRDFSRWHRNLLIPHARVAARHGFYAEALRAHLPCLAKLAGIGRIGPYLDWFAVKRLERKPSSFKAT